MGISPLKLQQEVQTETIDQVDYRMEQERRQG
jgi:hypothetical protein